MLFVTFVLKRISTLHPTGLTDGTVFAAKKQRHIVPVLGQWSSLTWQDSTNRFHQ